MNAPVTISALDGLKAKLSRLSDHHKLMLIDWIADTFSNDDSGDLGDAIFDGLNTAFRIVEDDSWCGICYPLPMPAKGAWEKWRAERDATLNYRLKGML